MKATQQLKEEHRGIEIMLSILEKVRERLERGEAVNPEHLKQILEFVSVFTEKCHHKKEEGLLFPAMGNASIPQENLLELMLGDHQAFHNLIWKMGEEVRGYNPENAKSGLKLADILRVYVEMLKKHIEQEDGIIYPLADKYLSEEEQQRLFTEFERVETHEIGAGKHEQFHKMLEELKSVYLEKTLTA